MSRLEGKVITVTNRDNIIARFSKEIPIGSRVVDNRNKSIGTIKGIFGPVDDPYYEIDPFDRDKHLTMKDMKLYLEEE